VNLRMMTRIMRTGVVFELDDNIDLLSPSLCDVFLANTGPQGYHGPHTSHHTCVRTNLANRPTEPMLVSFRTRYTKLWGNHGFLQSGSRQTTPIRVGVTCGSGISVVWVGRK